MGQAQNMMPLEKLANQYIQNNGVKGIAIVGVKEGKIVYKRGFGSANQQQQMDEKTPLYIASNTKAFVGLAAAKLIANGQLRLEDKMTKYIPASCFPDSLELSEITIQHLLSHTHGLSNEALSFGSSYTGLIGDDYCEVLSRTSQVAKLSDSVFHYSNFGYLIMGQVIQKVSGKNWKSFVESEVFNPLGMTESLTEIEGNSRIAIGYAAPKNEPLSLQKQDNILHAAGGLYSTLTDMGKWLCTFTDLKPKSGPLKDAFSIYENPLAANQDGFGPLSMEAYSFGWNYGKYFDRPFRFHTGQFTGHASYMSYLPEDSMGVFVYVNDQTAGPYISLQLSLLFYNLLLDHPAQAEVQQMLSGAIDGQFSQSESDSKAALSYNNDLLPVGKAFSQDFGELAIDTLNGFYHLKLGNLSSKIYPSKAPNEVLVEFIPGTLERLIISENNERISLQYDEYGSFRYYPPLKKHFDFWVGEWNVSWDEGDGKIGNGTNSITKILDGMAIQEDFRIEDGQSKGFVGTSISILTNQRVWKQTWMDNTGTYYDFTGDVEKGRPVFKTERVVRGASEIIQKMVFNNISKDGFIWDWLGTRDGGKTWNLLWQISYKRKN